MDQIATENFTVEYIMPLLRGESRTPLPVAWAVIAAKINGLQEFSFNFKLHILHSTHQFPQKSVLDDLG